MGWFSDTYDKVRSWVMSKLPTQDIFKAMGVSAPKSVSMPSEIEEWRRMYQGYPSWLKGDDASLNFPAVIAWDLAKKAIGELDITCSVGDQKTDEAAELFVESEIMPYLRTQIEYALSLGGVLARPWFDSKASKVRVAWYTQDNIVPVEWDGKTLVSAVLIDRMKSGKDTFTKLESHIRTATGYTIKTKLFKSDGDDADLGKEVPLSAIEQWAWISPEVEILQAERIPMFTYIPTPWANNRDLNSPIGTAIFKDAKKNLEKLDAAYNALCWEVESGRAAVFIADSMIPTKISGTQIKDDLDALGKGLYRRLESESDLFERWSPELRTDALNGVIKTQLSIVCMLCHVDSGAYIYDQAAQAVTATEVRTKNQTTYGTIVDIQEQMIRPGVESLMTAVKQIQALYDQKEFSDELEMGFDFGDSILIDEETDRVNAQTEVTQGLRSKVSYLMEYRGMTEADALAEIERINTETPTVTPFFGA